MDVNVWRREKWALVRGWNNNDCQSNDAVHAEFDPFLSHPASFTHLAHSIMQQSLFLFSASIGQYGSDQLGIIDFAGGGIHRFEQLIHLVVTHLLPKIRQDVAQLTDPNIAGHVLVKNLEATTILFWLAWVAKTVRSVKHLGEGFKID